MCVRIAVVGVRLASVCRWGSLVTRRWWKRLSALTTVTLVALASAACGSSSAAGNPKSATTEFATAGPYAAGTVHYVVAGDPVVVWYPVPKSSVTGRSPYTYHLRTWVSPAIRDLIPASFADGVTEDAYQGVPAASGVFPVVLFSHGYGGYPEQSTFLTADLATWGMVVVAPDQIDRDLGAVIAGKASVATPADVPEQLRGAPLRRAALADPGDLAHRSREDLGGRHPRALGGGWDRSAGRRGRFLGPRLGRGSLGCLRPPRRSRSLR